ncbi:hypothetical protein EJ07DRAFT_154435 [Lizonia empirigonia]|nr:hypothetical protein EJ07DRAFT_154435 [Lizonia empirigonia]
MLETIENASYSHGDSILRPVSEDTLDPKERSCCICYQPFGPTPLTQGGSEVPVQLPCSHVFGETCILSWTLTNNSCPLCRRGVFGVDDHSTNQHFSIPRNPNDNNHTVLEEDDIWLDVNVWNNSIENHVQNTVSFTDSETPREFGIRDHSNVYVGTQSRTSAESLVCTEHHGSCHCFDQGDTSIHEHLTPPATAHSRYMYTLDFYLTEVGSQFENLDYRYNQWMDEYL